MAYIVYLDETGDHSLELVDKDFPLFALAMFICDADIYNNKIMPIVHQLKIDYFGHETVILHSRDIRKAQKDFGFLTNSRKRNEFCERINKIMSDSDYSLIASVIRKQEHKDKYGLNADNPYDLAMMFCMERLLPFLEERSQEKVHLIAESRGKKEDDELMLSFLRIANQGTNFITAERFKKIDFKLRFVPKAMNVIGTQLADLAAYPIARYVHNPKRANSAYNVLRKKFYKGKGRVYGLKIFP
ncbi:DUF3800 domain-containing protein [Candidatus Omnitrophota bacterium]